MFKKIAMMNAIIFLFIGCTPVPLNTYRPSGLTQQLIDDGSKEMKLCKFECQKEETQCEIKINTEYMAKQPSDIYVGRVREVEKDMLKEHCYDAYKKCFTDICGGKIEYRK